MNTDNSIIQNWYIAYVHTNTEKKTSQLLDSMGIENYVALQEIVKLGRNGRKMKTTKKVIGGMVFVKCTDAQRLKEVAHIPYVLRFMMDRSGTQRKVATVPQSQMDLLRFMVGQSEVPVEFSQGEFAVGKKVRVVRGALMGIEGTVKEIKPDMTEVIVQLDTIGCARLAIESFNLESV